MVNMRWGEELWDGFERLSKYSSEGIQFYEQYEEFLKERCTIENAYAKSLRKLIKNYEFSKKTLSSSYPTTHHIITTTTAAVATSTSVHTTSTLPLSDDSCKLTYLKCFNRNLNEIKDMACQHELIAENFQKRVIDKLNVLIKNFKDDRRKCIDDKEKFYSTHQGFDEALRKSKTKYDYAFRDTEKAKEILQKVEADDNSSRIDIRKHQNIYEQKLRVCDQQKADYANQLCMANSIKAKYYDEQLPACVNVLQGLEEKRIKLFQEFSNECVNIEMEVIPRIERCYKGMQASIGEIAVDNDIECVVNALKTGYAKPSDHIFEDLSNPQPQLPLGHASTPTNNASNLSLNNEQTNGSGGSTSGSGNRAKYKTISRLRGLLKPKSELETLYDLPPQQQKKELKKKIDAINADISKEHKEREGLIKLKEIYQNNEKFGNSESALAALKNNDEKLSQLNAQLNKYKLLYDECERNGTLSRTKTLPSHHTNKHNTVHTLHYDNSSTNGGDTVSMTSPSTPVSRHGNSLQLNASPLSAQQQGSNGNNTEKHASSESFDDDIDDEDDSVSHNTITKNTPSAIAFVEAQYEHIDATKMPVIDDTTTAEAMQQQQHVDDEYEEQIIGRALVLYDFKGTVQNSITIQENEMLNVMERDSGDGWTLVKRMTTGEKGYVPTDYIRIDQF